ncbi:hypothetical protein [Belnapia rosea]|uniref:hypothetical protein n=1 Tax=Belnapia rosea TaxID=938405 RepID=UPI000882FE05|nr:hypothetical protein [Belnapia rosea]SDB75009.1 hypothetical protein SAMN02927895_05713 [Belnapia rosea]
MSDCGQAPDALMDPWCAVPVVAGGRVLFGFTLQHPILGRLSWARSSPLVTLDMAAGRATTASGRRYQLGRQVEPKDIPSLGDEAWLAFDLLIGLDAEDGDAVPHISADAARDARWLGACKMARHLGLAPPGRTAAETDAFVVRHFPIYFARRAAGKAN